MDDERDPDDDEALEREASDASPDAGRARQPPGRAPVGDILVDLAAVRARNAARWGTADICGEADGFRFPPVEVSPQDTNKGAVDDALDSQPARRQGLANSV